MMTEKFLDNDPLTAHQINEKNHMKILIDQNVF